MPDSLREKLEKARNRSIEVIDANDASESGGSKPRAKRIKITEKVGTGTPADTSVDSARRRLLRAKLKAVKDPAAKARIQAQLDALKK